MILRQNEIHSAGLVRNPIRRIRREKFSHGCTRIRRGNVIICLIHVNPCASVCIRGQKSFYSARISITCSAKGDRNTYPNPVSSEFFAIFAPFCSNLFDPIFSFWIQKSFYATSDFNRLQYEVPVRVLFGPVILRPWQIGSCRSGHRSSDR